MQKLIFVLAAICLVNCSHKSNNNGGGGPVPLDPIVTDLDLTGTPGDFVGNWMHSSCTVTVDGGTRACDVDVIIESSAPNELYIQLVTSWSESFGIKISGNDLLGGMGTIEGRIGKNALDVTYFGDTKRRLTAKLLTPKLLSYIWRTPGMSGKDHVFSGTVMRH